MRFLWGSQFLMLVAAFSSTLQDSPLIIHEGDGVIGITAETSDLKSLVEKFVDKVMKLVANNDPYQVGKADMNYNSYGIVSKGYMNNILLSFMSTTNLTNLIVDSKGSVLKFGFDLRMKELQMTSDAKWDFDALTMFNVSLAGQIGILLNGLGMTLRTSFTETKTKMLQFAEFDLKATLTNSKVVIEELNERKALGVYVSNIVTDILAIAINENPQVFTAVNIGLKSFLNSLMFKNSVTLDKVIDVMEHFIQ